MHTSTNQGNKRQQVVLAIAVIGGAALVCLGVGSAIARWADVRRVNEANLVGRKFIGFMKAHQYASAHTLLMPNTTASIEQLKAMEERTEKLNGALLDYSMTAWDIQPYKKIRVVHMRYVAHFTICNAFILLSFEEAGNGYRVGGFVFTN